MNMFNLIFIVDILLFAIFYLLGHYAHKKEFKDTWCDAETMEMGKSQKLSDDWEAKHPILTFFIGFYYETLRKTELSDDAYRAIKWFIQRGKRGYSDCDIWGFDYYLSEVIVKGLMDLKKQLHGHPCETIGSQSINVSKKEDNSSEMKEWKRIIETMIWTFKATRKIQDSTWIPVFDERKRPKAVTLVKNLKKPDKDPLFKNAKIEYHLMTKRDMERYEEGWKNFKKYYFDLWD